MPPSVMTRSGRMSKRSLHEFRAYQPRSGARGPLDVRRHRRIAPRPPVDEDLARPERARARELRPAARRQHLPTRSRSAESHLNDSVPLRRRSSELRLRRAIPRHRLHRIPPDLRQMHDLPGPPATEGDRDRPPLSWMLRGFSWSGSRRETCPGPRAPVGTHCGQAEAPLPATPPHPAMCPLALPRKLISFAPPREDRPVSKPRAGPPAYPTETDSVPTARRPTFGRMTISTSRSRWVRKRSNRSDEKRASL